MPITAQSGVLDMALAFFAANCRHTPAWSTAWMLKLLWVRPALDNMVSKTLVLVRGVGIGQRGHSFAFEFARAFGV